MIERKSIAGSVDTPRGVLGGSGGYSIHPYDGLSLMGLITFVCMGYALVRYIGIGYRKSYRCPIETPLFGHIRVATNTLRLSTARANGLYKQCVDHKVVALNMRGIA